MRARSLEPASFHSAALDGLRALPTLRVVLSSGSDCPDALPDAVCRSDLRQDQ